MKSEEEVLRRLKKLRGRYARQYLKRSQDRLHLNCVHNREHVGTRAFPDPADDGSPMRIRGGEEVEGLVAPDRHVRFGKTVSLVVLREEPSPVRLCMYGSSDPASWAGEVCDSDEKAASCPMFAPSVRREEAMAAFEELMRDDDHVYENYKDLAALQWVLGDRVHRHRPGLLERLLNWFAVRRAPVPAPAPALPEPTDREMEDIWKDDPAEDT